MLCQSDAHRAHGDESLLVEISDGPLKYFLAYVESLVDIVCLALVAQIAFSVIVEQVLVEGFSEIGSLFHAGLLQGDVYLAVWAYSSDVAL